MLYNIHLRSPSVLPSVNNYLNISSETGQQISMKLHRNDAWVMHVQILERFDFREELWLPWQPKEKNKNLLVPNRKGYRFHIWHVASSSGHLPKQTKLWPCCGN